MKKTVNINLSGYPFVIDEDAYQLLKDYLDTIRYAFDTNDDTTEIASDIESRIAELLLEKEGGRVRIVTIEEASRVIERIGRPSEFIEMKEDIETQGSRGERIEMEEKTEQPITPPPYNPTPRGNFFSRRKLFRDPQNSMLGGVCSGLSNYLHIDVTLIRLLAVLLFFLSATTVSVVYIVLWIVVPEANTPIKRMQMMGEDPTFENIGRTVTEQSRDWKDTTVNTKFGNVMSNIFSVFVKCLMIIGFIIAAPLLLAMAVGILGCAIAIFVISIGLIGGEMFDSTMEGLLVLYILFAVVGGCITIGVPLWLFLKSFRKNKSDDGNATGSKSLLVVWLCGIALVSVFSVCATKKWNEIDSRKHMAKIEKIIEKESVEELNEEELNIEIEGNSVTDSLKEQSEDSIAS